MKDIPSNEISFDKYLIRWDRLSPYIVTDIDSKREFGNELIKKYQPLNVITELKSPKHLYELLKTHPNESFLFDCGLLEKRKNYIDILEGAVCSSPDSMNIWPVRYRDYKDFKFLGRVIIFTNLSIDQVRDSKKLKYIYRDTLKI